MVSGTPKARGAFRTIGEVSEATGLPQHVLRYWETRFPQLRPVTRAGNRRYYRPEDVALVRRIDALLNTQGYTVRGVQQLLTGPFYYLKNKALLTNRLPTGGGSELNSFTAAHRGCPPA